MTITHWIIAIAIVFGIIVIWYGIAFAAEWFSGAMHQSNDIAPTLEEFASQGSRETRLRFSWSDRFGRNIVFQKQFRDGKMWIMIDICDRDTQRLRNVLQSLQQRGISAIIKHAKLSGKLEFANARLECTSILAAVFSNWDDLQSLPVRIRSLGGDLKSKHQLR